MQVSSAETLLNHMKSEASQHIGLINDACVTLQHHVGSLQSTVDSQLEENREIQRSCQRQTQELSQRSTVLENHLTELSANQKMMQQKTLEACYQSVDNLQKEMKAKMDSFEHLLRGLTEKCIKFEEIIATQSARIQQLEETARATHTDGVSQTIQQQFQAQDRVLAAHDIKLAEHGLRLDMMDCKNTEGVLLWKITEIRRRRREAVSGKTPSIYSQPFYTSPNGYKMCARLYLNGDGMGRGTHLSLFFVVMRGEYDSLLVWPFHQKVTLVLIDQEGRRHISDTFRPDPSSSSFKKPRTEMNIASGCPLFVSLATLDSGGYVRDDTLFIKIVVDTNDLTRPDAR
jgi:TNF receptor-associated factor 3